MISLEEFRRRLEVEETSTFYKPWCLDAVTEASHQTIFHNFTKQA